MKFKFPFKFKVPSKNNLKPKQPIDIDIEELIPDTKENKWYQKVRELVLKANKNKYILYYYLKRFLIKLRKVLEFLIYAKAFLTEILVNSIITTLIISFPKRKVDNDLEVNVNYSNIIFLSLITIFFLFLIRNNLYLMDKYENLYLIDKHKNNLYFLNINLDNIPLSKMLKKDLQILTNSNTTLSNQTPFSSFETNSTPNNIFSSVLDFIKSYSFNLLSFIIFLIIVSLIIAFLVMYSLKDIRKSIIEKVGVAKHSLFFFIFIHLFFVIYGLILGMFSIFLFIIDALNVEFIVRDIRFMQFPYDLSSVSYILLSNSIILLGISKFFYSIVLNTLERFLLPNVYIIYFATKEELIDIKRSYDVGEQISTSLIENYRGYLLIPWIVRDKFRNPYVENSKEENFYEYMLKRLVRYFINIKHREASYKYTPLFIVYIFNIFIPIFVFIGLLGVIFMLKQVVVNKILIIMGVSLFFVIWYLFFLRTFLLMLPSNILQILGKYIYRNLVDNIHLIIKKPMGITEEINIYEVLNRADFSKQDMENINQIFQIVVVIILTLSLAGFITLH